MATTKIKNPKQTQAELVDAIHARGEPVYRLVEFLKRAWHVLEPVTPYVHAWPADAICEHLEAMTFGHIKNLLINVPPGTSKSTICSVVWPAWIWTFKPGWRSMFATYSDGLSLRDAAKMRMLVESDWYRTTFRPKWQMSGDTNSKGYFQNSTLGFRVSTSVGGQTTGYRGDVICVDDPHNATEVQSKASREATKFWWDQAFSNRLNSLVDGRRLVIMQRLHEDDLSGHIIAKEAPRFEHLCLPMQYESKRRCKTSLPFEDPRTVDGDLLMPSRFPADTLEAEKKRLGSSGYAGQHQQRPAPEGGNRFQKAWWRFWKPDGVGSLPGVRPDGCAQSAAVPLPPRFDDMVISVDCTFKGQSRAALKSELDYVAMVVVGKLGANKFMLDRRHGQVGIAETMNWIRELRADHPRARRILIEDKANGSAVIELLQDELDGIIPIEPAGGKEARANACEPQVEAGNFYLPDGAPWLDSFVEEFALFPNGRHDDQVDAVTQALVWWIAGGKALNRARMMGTW